VKPETLVTLPLEAARMVGAGVLWLTERFIPANPGVETKAASITFYPSREEQPDEGGLKRF
jgi:hypothetical protein